MVSGYASEGEGKHSFELPNRLLAERPFQVLFWIRQSWVCVLFPIGSTFTQSSCRFDRRFRVFDISEYGETIKTYKRTEKDEIIDQMTLAGAGAAPSS